MAETHKLRTNDLLPKTKEFQNLNKKAEDLAKKCAVATLPSLDHLKMADYETVYEPSDDTYLMLDALSWEFDHTTCTCIDDNHTCTNVVNCETTSTSASTSANISHVPCHRYHDIQSTLEIGTGTGVSTVYLAMVLQQQKQQHSCVHIVTDINPNAIQITKQTAIQNNINIENLKMHLCDIATPLLTSHSQNIDVIIFNPPYVPTPDHEVGSNGIEASWAGGTDGRMVIDRALPQIAALLSRPHGVAYMITVDDNKPEDIASTMMNEYGIVVQPLLRRRARNEFLSVLKMTFQHESATS